MGTTNQALHFKKRPVLSSGCGMYVGLFYLTFLQYHVTLKMNRVPNPIAERTLFKAAFNNDLRI